MRLCLCMCAGCHQIQWRRARKPQHFLDKSLLAQGCCGRLLRQPRGICVLVCISVLVCVRVCVHVCVCARVLTCPLECVYVQRERQSAYFFLYFVFTAGQGDHGAVGISRCFQDRIQHKDCRRPGLFVVGLRVKFS